MVPLPFDRQVRTFDEGRDPDAIRPAKGIHITVPWDKVRNDVAVVIPVPGEKRTLFVVPWLPKPEGGFTFTYVGTTDLTRRTRARLQDARACVAAASDDAHLLAPDLGWDAARIEQETAAFCASVETELVAASASPSTTGS
jgi:glycerol-3-phosphate dehydrogenase